MHSSHFLQDLAAVMVVAAATTLLCRRLNQPVVIGYLLAGLIIGPFTPPFSLIHTIDSIHTTAELGLVFLMFYLGLEFNLPKLRKVGFSAALAAVLEVVGMFAIGFWLGGMFGWSRMDSIFLGAILSISSTAIIVKVFSDLKMSHEEFAQAVFGILILEDIVAIVILSVLSGLSNTGSVEVSRVAAATIKIIFFVILFLIIGLSLVPRIIHWTARFRSREMMGILILGFCLSGALIASWCGFSVALGGFLMGAVVAASKEIETIEEWFQPVRDMFSAIFFVSAGMLLQPGLLWKYKGAILVVVLATLAGKVLSGTAGSVLAGFRLKTSAKIGFSLAQIGEFSFVIASLGVSSKAASEFLYPLAVMVSTMTAFCTPYMIRFSDTAVDRLIKISPPGVLKALDAYHDRLNRRHEREKSPETVIFSKYLIRLVAYAALLASLVLAVQALCRFSPHILNAEPHLYLFLTAWMAAGILSAPLMMLISKYASHFILLLSTMSSRSPVLKYFNIRLFYNTVNIIFFILIGSLYLKAANPWTPSVFHSFLLGFGIFFSGLYLTVHSKSVIEGFETLLDEVFGLATSEPTRQAVLKSAGRESIFESITRQVMVKAGSPAAHHSIRDLRIRELTGASVVAVYRQGKHIANPSPDTKILPEDVLIFLGGEQECNKAQELVQMTAQA